MPLICQDSVPDKNFEVSKPNFDVLSENQKLKQENASLTKALTSYKEEFLNYRNKSERKIEELTGIKQELESEIQRMKEELDIIIAQLEEEAKKRNFNNNHDIKSLKNNLLKEKEENNLLRSELNSCRKEVELLRQRETSNKVHIEMLTKKLENCEDKSIDSPISADSPRNTPLRLSVSDSASLTNKNFEEFNSYVSKLHEVLKKNKN